MQALKAFREQLLPESVGLRRRSGCVTDETMPGETLGFLEGLEAIKAAHAHQPWVLITLVFAVCIYFFYYSAQADKKRVQRKGQRTQKRLYD